MHDGWEYVEHPQTGERRRVSEREGARLEDAKLMGAWTGSVFLLRTNATWEQVDRIIGPPKRPLENA